MANSLDQIFRNFINRIIGGNDEDTVAETRADQGGLMAPRVVRPRARPEDVEPVGGAVTGAASTGNIALKRFVDGLNEATKIDVSLRPRARPLENTLIDANLSADKLQLKHNMPLYKFQQENETGSDDGSTIKLFSAPTSDAAIDEIATQATSLFEKITRPRARPKSVEDIDVATSAMALGVIPVKGKSYTPTIRDTQIMLDSAGYNVGKIDGIDGPLTQAAVKAFQKDAGFTGRDVDGKFGPKTLAAFIQKNPQVTKKELPPIKEETLSVPLSEGLTKRPGIKTLDPLKGTVKNLEDRYTTETSKLINETRDIPDLDMEKSTKAITRIDASVFGALGEALGSLGLGTAEFRFFGNNIIKPGGTYTEKNLNTSDKKLLKKAIASAKADGRNYIDYEKDLGVEEMEVNKASPFAGIVDPAMRMARSIGVFSFTNDKDGNTIIEDTFDFNPGPKRIAYYEALKRGDKKEALYLLSPLANTSPVEAASMIGYARQENLKAKGEAYQTIIRINLGKV